MKKAILITPKSKSVPNMPDYDYIGVDAGALLVLKAGYPLKFAIGDFDSMNEESYNQLLCQTKVYKHPIEKDETDSELAVRTCNDFGYDQIILWGGISGRLDHTMINILLLLHRDPNLVLMDENQKVQLLSIGSHCIQKGYRHISFFALEKTIITLKDFLYPLEHQEIDCSDLYLSSNSLLDSDGTVLIEKGKVLCIESNFE